MMELTCQMNEKLQFAKQCIVIIKDFLNKPFKWTNLLWSQFSYIDNGTFLKTKGLAKIKLFKEYTHCTACTTTSTQRDLWGLPPLLPQGDDGMRSYFKADSFHAKGLKLNSKTALQEH